MKKISLVCLALLVMVVSAMAQNVNEGIKQLYYQKYNTAKQTLQQAVNANPKDPNAIYWLGQVFLAMDDVEGAKSLYQKALNEGVNDPMIWVGMGHVESLNKRKNEARQHFEAAITASLDRRKNPNPRVLAAIGRANADGGSDVGDPQYAIEKLKKAAELDKNDPEIYLNMGINYQKLGGDRGGEAVQAYNNALLRDPKYAKALYRIGRIYESQSNLDLFTDYYTKAIAADPAYTETYLALYEYYKNRDVNKALGYLQEYIKNAEQNPDNEYFMADYLFRAGKYQESLNLGKQLENKYGLAALPKLSVLYAYNYDRLGDSVKARTNIERYLSSAKPQQIQADHFVLAGAILAKFPGSEEAASAYLEKAIQADTIHANQLDYMKTAAQIFEKAGKYEQQYQWLYKLASADNNWSELDHYRLNDVSMKALKFQRVYDTLAPKYIAAFPDKPQGYAFRVRAAKAIDSTGDKGLAIEPINQQNEYLLKDTAANKKAVYLNYYYMLVYYNDKAKDLPKAIEMTEKMMALYPEGSEEFNFAKKTNDVLVKALERRGGGQRSSGNAAATTKAAGSGK
ncbi:MAG TPA: tetratricopeptide repeat protein [Chitinophagaceae bacterium]